MQIITKMEMKKSFKKIIFLVILVCVFTTFKSVKAASISADINYSTIDVTAELKAENLKFIDLEGNEINEFVYLRKNSAATIDAIIDGDESSYGGIAAVDAEGNKVRGWFIMDLGDTFTINEIMVSMDHDWSGFDVVIQVATDAAFTNAITIYNNDTDNSLGLGLPFSADSSIKPEQLYNYGANGNSSAKNGNIWSFTPVAARYVRVTNNDYGDLTLKNYTAITEVNVYGFDPLVEPTATKEVAPAAASLVSGTYYGKQSIELTSIYDNAKIYYTLDGKLPTENSTEYTAPIRLAEASVAHLIRAIVVVDGISSVPMDYSFKLLKADSIFPKDVTEGLDAKNLKFVDYEGTEYTDFIKTRRSNASTPIEAIIDGDESSYGIISAVDAEGNKLLGWFVMDLGEVYSIDEIMVSADHDWKAYDYVIQVATKEDFSDAVTIYNNDKDNSLGLGSTCTIDRAVPVLDGISNMGNYGTKNTSKNGNVWTIAPAANARYVRVTNNNNKANYTACTEINVRAIGYAQDTAAEFPKFVPLTSESVKVVDLAGNEVAKVDMAGPTKNEFTYTKDSIIDGYEGSYGSVAPYDAEGNKILGWFILDLGQVYSINRLMLSMRHDWQGRDVVIQVATKADFSDAKTIYNNDMDNSLGLGATFTADATIAVSEGLKNYGNNILGPKGDTSQCGNIFRFESVNARYVRVTNNQYGDGALQNYTACAELYVVADGYGSQDVEVVYETYIKKVDVQDTLKVLPGVELAALTEELNKVLKATLSDDTTRIPNGTWAIEGYDPAKEGTYTAVFTSTDSADIFELLKSISVEVNVHECKFGSEWVHDETNHWHECSCGEKTEVAEHAWDEGTVTTAPTCEEKGVKTFTCTCGKTRTEEVKALGHTEVVEQEIPSTCAEKGAKIFACEVCHEKTRTEELPLLPHTEVVDQAVAATCTAKGKTEGKHCSVCNEVLVAQEEVAALGHTEVVDQAVAATCTAKGKTEGKHCSVCNEVLVAQEEVAALGHTEVVDQAVAATCTEKGKTEGKHCSVCNEVLVAQEEVATLDHTYDDQYDATCNVCNATREVPEKPVEEKGCNGSVVASIFGLLALTGSVVVLRKKREE